MIHIPFAEPEVDAPIITIAEDQPEFQTVRGAQVTHRAYGMADGADHNSLLFALRPTDEQRARIAAGEDIYLSLLTYGGPMQGILALVGKKDASAVYNVVAL